MTYSNDVFRQNNLLNKLRLYALVRNVMSFQSVFKIKKNNLFNERCTSATRAVDSIEIYITVRTGQNQNLVNLLTYKFYVLWNKLKTHFF